MGRTDGGDNDPLPRPLTKTVDLWRPRLGTRRTLPYPTVQPTTRFFDVADRRRSVRRLGPIGSEQMSALLWHGARVRDTLPAGPGHRWQQRAAPSAGGIHPIEILVFQAHDSAIVRYDPIAHAFDDLLVSDAQLIKAGRDRLRSALPDARGADLVLAADLARTDAAYEHPESLVWRDAGALLAVLQLTATALDLGFCISGILGLEIVRALDGPPTLLAAGTAVVGELI